MEEGQVFDNQNPENVPAGPAPTPPAATPVATSEIPASEVPTSDVPSAAGQASADQSPAASPVETPAAQDDSGSVNGIFSTGELSISDEAASDVANVSADQAKINAAFAKTAHYDIAVPVAAASSASATGDIRLPSEKKKHHILPIIIAAVAVAGVVGAVLVLTLSRGTSLKTAIETFSSSMYNSPNGEYIYEPSTTTSQSVDAADSNEETIEDAVEDAESGEEKVVIIREEVEEEPVDETTETETEAETETEESENDRSQPFILVADEWLSGDELLAYYDTVEANYLAFIEKSSGNNNEVISVNTDSIKQTFPTTLAILRRSEIEKTLISLVDAGDTEAAEKYVSDLDESLSSSDKLVQNVKNKYIEYLNTETKLFSLYDQGDCLDIDTVDYQCVSYLRHSTFESLNETVNEDLRHTEGAKNLLVNNILYSLEIILNNLEQNQ